MQQLIRPCVPWLEVCESEAAHLEAERKSAQADALRREGYPGGYRPVLGCDPVASLTDVHRGADGVVRACIVVEIPTTRRRYRRRVAAPQPLRPGLERTVKLRGRS